MSDASTAERNVEIWSAYQGGASFGQIAAVYGISLKRAKQIVHTAAAHEYLRLYPPRRAGGAGRAGEAT
ncbi:hypothetical protein [Baekduia sp. Peel2402]|uniref:hypothetical protein n=1 Tax=Baekduia sp. Peel2402 TaxID=3458296 RepID=UPI00403EAF7E